MKTDNITTIKKFIKRWQEAEGNEQREANSFWIEFCHDVLGIHNPTHYLDFERRVKGRRIDVFYEDMGILIESKSRGVDLDKQFQRGRNEGGDARLVTAYKQAKWYADNLPNSARPRWILTMNFDEIRIYDLDKEYPEREKIIVKLEELSNRHHLFSFFTEQTNSSLYVEKKLSLEAGELVGKLYDRLSKQYLNLDTSEQEQHSLNVLIVRLVFLLYAEDSGLLQSHQAFYKYMKDIPVGRWRQTLIQLFEVLNTPEDQRDPYLDSNVDEFPYINGGLFSDSTIIIPQFSEEFMLDLLYKASNGFDWSDISPTIFGAAFESTLNPETRRSGGMHYTSIENIHKVIDPLFLDDLKAELIEIENIRSENKRKQKLRIFQKKISELKFLDPACGSGNFLTETYVSLKKLELRIIENLQDNQATLFQNPDMVSIHQMYGIEINDFAVSVAKTALWIAEQQMLIRTQELLPFQEFKMLPLKDIEGVVCGNALRMDWNDVLPAQNYTYIMGNPPFVGKKEQSKQQKMEIRKLFSGIKSGNLDYVTGWYAKTASYCCSRKIFCAFVSTNSITQGEQPYSLWSKLADYNIEINFASRSFIWSNEANNVAHVHVVIIGFSSNTAGKKFIFDKQNIQIAKDINPYLINTKSNAIGNRRKPLCYTSVMNYGSMPIDNGFLILNKEDRELITNCNEKTKTFIRRYMGGNELLNNKKRYCIWIKEEQDYSFSDEISRRVRLCKEFRESSSRPQTLAAAKTPYKFGEIRQPETSMLVLPKVSSERRNYIPIGYVSSEIIINGSALLLPNASLYNLGVLTSHFHNAWMRCIAGRMKSDYQYSISLVYNNFPWPGVTKDKLDTPVEECVSKEHQQTIETCAQNILDVRDKYPDKNLAYLYDPDKMPQDLLEAHKALDREVERAYGVEFNGDEEKIVAHLFKLYAELTSS